MGGTARPRATPAARTPWPRLLLAAALVAATGAAPARAEDPPAAYERALKASPAEQRKLVRDLAVSGDVRAAARMIDLAMWDEMKDVPVGTPPIEAWRDLTGEFSEMTGAQVHACVEANWAWRQTSKPVAWRLERIRAARERLVAADVTSPALAVEVASWFRDVEPTDATRVRSFEAAALPRLESPGADLDPLARGTRLLDAARIRSRPGSPHADFGRAGELARQAAKAFAEAGDPLGEGRSGHLVAVCLVLADDRAKAAVEFERAAALSAKAREPVWEAASLREAANCLRPGPNPAGDWTAAASAYERAARAFGAAGDESAQAECLHDAGRCLQRDRNPKGDWARAATNFEKAAALRERTGDRERQAESLHEQGWCVIPENDPAGNWARAAALFQRAAEMSGSVGDVEAQAESLYQYARCLRPENDPANGDWARAAAVYERAAALRAKAGDKGGQARCLDEQARCLRPDLNPAGDWARAADLHARAAALQAEAGDRRAEAYSLRHQGLCLVRNDRARMTAEARALFERAAKLARAAGDAEGARWAEDWLR